MKAPNDPSVWAASEIARYLDVAEAEGERTLLLWTMAACVMASLCVLLVLFRRKGTD